MVIVQLLMTFYSSVSLLKSGFDTAAFKKNKKNNTTGHTTKPFRLQFYPKPQNPCISALNRCVIMTIRNCGPIMKRQRQAMFKNELMDELKMKSQMQNFLLKKGQWVSAPSRQSWTLNLLICRLTVSESI